ncbi:MAG: DUF2027 domain-containing protein [Bacteroidota bacterium]
MNFRVGQKVRYLHETGEGIITNLIDRNHVEVDFGDDFPIDLHVDEIIPVDQSEGKFIGGGESSETAAPKKQQSRVLGTSVLEVSLVIVPDETDRYDLYLVNPEPIEILFSAYLRIKQKYQGLAAGHLDSGAKMKLAQVGASDLGKVKAFYIQFLHFKPGPGHPHTPIVVEIPWTSKDLKQPRRFVEAVTDNAWIKSLRSSKQKADIDQLKESDFIRIRDRDKSKPKIVPEIDLHIEELVADPLQMSPSDMLRTQIRRLEEAMGEAALEDYDEMVLIHGIGNGTLKSAVIEALKAAPHVKSFESADPARFGNGATKVFFH